MNLARTNLLNAALDTATRHPDGWLQGSPAWATRDGETVHTGLAGHVVMTAGAELHWLNRNDTTTNYVKADTGLIAEYADQISDYVEERHLGWPHGLCSIFLAARLLLGMEEAQALKLFTGNHTLEYSRGLVAGFLIGEDA